MTDTIRTILIDPEARAVTEIQLEVDGGSTLDALYKALNCGTIDGVGLGTHESGFDIVMLVDDNGMLSDGNSVFFFNGNPISGRAVVTADDPEGDPVDLPPTITLADIEKFVVWTDKVSTGSFGPSKNGITDHPLLGPNTFVHVGGAPILRDKEPT